MSSENFSYSPLLHSISFSINLLCKICVSSNDIEVHIIEIQLLEFLGSTIPEIVRYRPKIQ